MTIKYESSLEKIKRYSFNNLTARQALVNLGTDLVRDQFNKYDFFMEVWNKSTHKEKQKVIHGLIDSELSLLRQWIRNYRSDNVSNVWWEWVTQYCISYQQPTKTTMLFFNIVEWYGVSSDKSLDRLLNSVIKKIDS